jgi:uncharacterized protein involved in outer membrane biogenesis
MVETPVPGRRRRRWLVALIVLAALGLAAALAVHRYSRPQRLADLLVDQVRAQLGAELQLGGDAGFQLMPRLRAVLPRPRLVPTRRRVRAQRLRRRPAQRGRRVLPRHRRRWTP